jgi:uncharacterized protein DUF4389
MISHPVDIEVTTPQKLDRIQVMLRLAVVLAIGYIGISLGWLFFAFYLLLPVVAAILVTQKGGAGYLRDHGPALTRVLRWLVAFYAYMLLVTDRFPTGDETGAPRLAIEPGGQPTVGSALARLVLSIPSALVLGFLMLISAVVMVIAVLSILIAEQYAPSLYAFQLGVVRWHARLLAYHASLVDAYPPFTLEGGPGHDEPSHHSV